MEKSDGSPKGVNPDLDDLKIVTKNQENVIEHKNRDI